MWASRPPLSRDFSQRGRRCSVPSSPRRSRSPSLRISTSALRWSNTHRGAHAGPQHRLDRFGEGGRFANADNPARIASRTRISLSFLADRVHCALSFAAVALTARNRPRRPARWSGFQLGDTAGWVPPVFTGVPIGQSCRRRDYSRARALNCATAAPGIAVDADGAVAFAFGEVDAPVFPRSAVKAMQALPLIESGAADQLGGSPRPQIALACASHSGEEGACRSRRRRCSPRIGLDASALACGAHWPLGEEAARALARAGRSAVAAAQQLLGQARRLPLSRLRLRLAA